MKNIIRTLGNWPVIGRPVRILVAIARLPQILDRQEAFAHRQLQLEQTQAEAAAAERAATEHRAGLDALCSELQGRINALGVEVLRIDELPKITATLTELERRQALQDKDASNLVNSVPVALRAHTWDLKQLAVRIEALEQQRAGTEMQDVDALRPLPERVTELSASLLELINRVEFVRSELMFEMRYGAATPLASTADAGEGRPSIERRVVEPGKLAEAQTQGRLRLNLGCGHVSLPEYLNVDRRELPGVDIVADAGDIPVAPGEVDEVFSAHMLEHFPQEQLRRELLPYWRDLLRAGGTFRAVVPDAEAMISEYANGRYTYEDLREVTFGAQDYDGDFHFNMFTPASLAKLLEEAGFRDVKVLESARRNGACYEFDIMATK